MKTHYHSCVLFIATLLVVGTSHRVEAQDFGYLSGSYGSTYYSNAGLDLFVHSFNDANVAQLDVPMPALRSGSGFGFETAYAYNVDNVALVIFSTELHNYNQESEAVFVDGSSRRLGLRLQDLSSTSTLGIFTSYGMIGPAFGTTRRSVRLDSSSDVGLRDIAVARDRGLDGTYESSNLLFEYGGHIILGHGAFQVQAKLLRPFQKLYPSRLLFDDDSGSKTSPYFPTSYTTFVETERVGRRDGLRDAFTGWHLSVSLAIAFPV
ncbi:MAG: hypothetical protein HKN43_12905 [Rhodothermales bacterium]|nr:hypothetical protein [Rhodothermales bacterium]